MANAKTVTRKEAWSVEELSRSYGLSRGYWWNEIRRGTLPSKRFGRRVLILQKDLDAYLEALEAA
jgi:excisionase family DNA binding protein